MTYEHILTRTEADKVGIITLNRPKQLNALNDQLMTELGQALQAFDVDPAIACMIITGSEKAFAAGADIGGMATYSFADVYNRKSNLASFPAPVAPNACRVPLAKPRRWTWP